MNKDEAKQLLNKLAQSSRAEMNFASVNSSADVFWLNPDFSVLQQDWTLVLNDQHNRKIDVLFIPANSISSNIVRSRTDDPTKMHIEIRCNDYVDRKSVGEQLCFQQWKICSINY